MNGSDFWVLIGLNKKTFQYPQGVCNLERYDGLPKTIFKGSQEEIQRSMETRLHFSSSFKVPTFLIFICLFLFCFFVYYYLFLKQPNFFFMWSVFWSFVIILLWNVDTLTIPKIHIVLSSESRQSYLQCLGAFNNMWKGNRGGRLV